MNDYLRVRARCAKAANDMDNLFLSVFFLLLFANSVSLYIQFRVRVLVVLKSVFLRFVLNPIHKSKLSAAVWNKQRKRK